VVVVVVVERERGPVGSRPTRDRPPPALGCCAVLRCGARLLHCGSPSRPGHTRQSKSNTPNAKPALRFAPPILQPHPCHQHLASTSVLAPTSPRLCSCCPIEREQGRCTSAASARLSPQFRLGARRCLAYAPLHPSPTRSQSNNYSNKKLSHPTHTQTLPPTILSHTAMTEPMYIEQHDR
jgi:hypothetical protein